MGAHWSNFWNNIAVTAGSFADFSEIEDIYNSCMAAFCVLCAGLAAGLTIGLLSLDLTKLEIKLMTGTEDEKAAVTQIIPIVKQHHLLLVTLLLFNALANETLPIFLGAIVPNYIAVILSVTLVLVFGEIIPSALFTGPDQLLTAAKLTKLVYFLLLIFYPISYPISKLLDYCFGAEENSGAISREELAALVVLQGKSSGSGRSGGSGYDSGISSPVFNNPRRSNSNKSGSGGLSIQTTDEASDKMPLLPGPPSRSASEPSPHYNSHNNSSTLVSGEDNHHGEESQPILTDDEVSLMTGILRLRNIQ